MSSTRLAKENNRGESKINRCLEMALYQTRESREASIKRRRSSSLKFPISSPCVHLSRVFDSLAHSTISYISVNKKKRKEANHIFNTSTLLFFPVYNKSILRDCHFFYIFFLILCFLWFDFIILFYFFSVFTFYFYLLFNPHRLNSISAIQQGLLWH